MQSSYLIQSCIRFLGDAFREQTLFFGSCSTCCGWGARQATCTCFHSCSRGRVQMYTGLGRIRKGKCKKNKRKWQTIGTSIHSTSSLSLFCPSLCFRELCLQRLNTSPKGRFGMFWTRRCFCLFLRVPRIPRVGYIVT